MKTVILAISTAAGCFCYRLLFRLSLTNDRVDSYPMTSSDQRLGCRGFSPNHRKKKRIQPRMLRIVPRWSKTLGVCWSYDAGQIRSRPHTTWAPKWWFSTVREVPLFQANLGGWNIMKKFHLSCSHAAWHDMDPLPYLAATLALEGALDR